MTQYIGVILTKDGYFCVAPSWEVKEGDLVGLTDITGKTQIHEVIAVVIDEKDGQYLAMLEKYIGYPLPRITAKYNKSEVVWDVSDNDR